MAVIDPEVWPIIILVLATVAMVLAIAGANVANLVLARATVRQRELAIRLAIGASRWRVVRQLVTETLILSLAGGAAGLLVTTWLLSALYPLGVSWLPFEWGRVVLDLSPDLRVFGYTFAIAAVAGILLGLVPALQASSPRTSAALHDDATLVGTRLKRSRLRQALVAAQVAMCLALLTGAGLLARGLQRARALDLGFEVGGVVFSDYDLRRHGYTAGAAADYNRALAEAIRPSATSVALTSHVPPHGGVVRATVHADGQRDSATCTRTHVSPSYFRVLGIAVTGGRAFSDVESEAGSPVGVISAGLAARFWPGLDPVGRRLDVNGIPVPITIVGVVRDTSNASLWREKEMSLYLPAGLADPRDLHVLARSAGGGAPMANALRARARLLDPRITFRATSLDELLELWILPSRVAAVAAVVLGLIALALASLGLYGVLGYTVAHRTREIGLRIALGASGRDVMRLILGDGARLIAAGGAVGIVGAFLVGRLLRRFLFDLAALDPVAFVAVPLFLCAVSLAACYLPARRASRIAPLDALRNE